MEDIRLRNVYMTSQLLLILLLMNATLAPAPATPTDYCVIGAGPAGLQMGYFLQRAGRDYVIFERANVSGSFFQRYPRHRTLISINKRFTGRTNKEFNMRHDWNSLLSHDPQLEFRQYSEEFFPSAEDMVRYLSDYQQRLGLKVIFDTEVKNVRRVGGRSSVESLFTMNDQRGKEYTCRRVIVASGMWKPNRPKFHGAEHVDTYESVSVDPDDFRGKKVLILGRGNSAFETADRIYGSTNLVHMVGRSRARLAWSTHYVGDLRAINNNLLDTYQLKSLDGILEASVDDMMLEKREGKIYVQFPWDSVSREFLKSHGTSIRAIPGERDVDNFSLREGYDHVIMCLGFSFDDSLFHNSSKASRSMKVPKYPGIKQTYESLNLPGLFFAGTITHSLDFRRSAGGFIHGFRYTVRALHRILEHKYHGVRWPSSRHHVTELVNVVVKRINEAAGPYQMFGLLGDVIIFHKKDDFNQYDRVRHSARGSGFPLGTADGADRPPRRVCSCRPAGVWSGLLWAWEGHLPHGQSHGGPSGGPQIELPASCLLLLPTTSYRSGNDVETREDGSPTAHQSAPRSGRLPHFLDSATNSHSTAAKVPRVVRGCRSTQFLPRYVLPIFLDVENSPARLPDALDVA